MHRSVTVVALALLMCALSSIPATAEIARGPDDVWSDSMMRGSSGTWDPNDVKGRFDFRWVGAAYTAAGAIHLTVSFYAGYSENLAFANFKRNVVESRADNDEAK